MVILKVLDSGDRGGRANLCAIALPVGGRFALGFVVRCVGMAHCLYGRVLVGNISGLHMYFSWERECIRLNPCPICNECGGLGFKE